MWAPFYTLHKIMAGLLDMYTLAGSEQALVMLKGMAGWVRRYAMPLGEAHMARVLEREYGGMNEVLYDLGAVTGRCVLSTSWPGSSTTSASSRRWRRDATS